MGRREVDEFSPPLYRRGQQGEVNYPPRLAREPPLKRGIKIYVNIKLCLITPKSEI